MSLFRVALVGCGIISESHICAYKQHADRARISVCCDLDRAKAEQRAQLVGDARAVTSFEEILNDPDVDAVEICTPHHLHTDAVIAAARAGKQILCQKPLAKSLDECDAMIDAAREAGVTLFYGEMTHTQPSVEAAKRAVAEGRIGQLIGLQATYGHWQGGEYLSTAWRYNPQITGGGQLLDGGIHYIDILLNIGGPIQSVSCFTKRFRPELGGEDTAVVNMQFAEGHLGTLFATQAAGIMVPSASVVVFGTEGILTLGGPHGALALHRTDLPNRHEVLLEKNGDVFAAMIGRYLDTVVDGAPNASPPEVGRENLKVVLAAYESARLGRVISL